MRFTSIVVLALFLFISCESPQDTSNTPSLYKGQVILHERAPFLLNGNSLSKDTDGVIILDEEVPDGTVYGLKDDDEVYAAEGGEILPTKTWVDPIGADPVEVSLGSKLVITFTELAEVTILESMNIFYIDASGTPVVFSGSGVITTNEIITGPAGFVTLISATAFSIGGDGGEFG